LSSSCELLESAARTISLFGHVPETLSLTYASVLYAPDMSGLVAFLAFFTHELTIEENRLIEPELLCTYKSIRNYLFLSAGIFLLTMLLQFWEWRILGIPLRFYLWVLPIVRLLAEKRVGRIFEDNNRRKDQRSSIDSVDIEVQLA